MRRVVEGLEAARGSDHPDTARARGNLRMLLLDLNKHEVEGAAQLLQRSD